MRVIIYVSVQKVQSAAKVDVVKDVLGGDKVFPDIVDVKNMLRRLASYKLPQIVLASFRFYNILSLVS